MTDLFADKRQTEGGFLSYAGYVIFALVLALNVAFRTFSEVGLSLRSVLSVTADCVLYVTSVYVIFCTMADTARRDAKGREAYLRALGECEEAICRAKPYRTALGAYVTAFVREEHLERVRETVECHGLDFCRYLGELAHRPRRELKEKGLSPYERRAVRRADRLRPLRVDRASLFEPLGRGSRRSLLASPTRTRLRRYGAALAPTTVFAMFSAQVVFAIEAQTDLWAVAVEAGVRIALLTWTAIRGYATGEKTILSDTVSYLRGKTDLLAAFVSQAEKGSAL